MVSDKIKSIIRRFWVREKWEHGEQNWLPAYPQRPR